jgi:Holliday junction resolvasome RuvABC endonuclease subunit
VNPLIKIVGIDPSLRNTGLAVATYNMETGDLKVEKIGLVQTENETGKTVRKSSDDYRAAGVLIRGINAFVKLHGAAFVVAEIPSGGQDARSAFAFGLCCGVLAAVPVPLIQVSPREVKMAAVGSPTATKGQMISWAMDLWPEAGWHMRKLKGAMVPVADNEHPADACAAIVAGTQTAQFAQALALMEGMRQVPA